MSLRNAPSAPSPLISRLAVGGMSLAVVALGALSVWSAFVTQREADDLTRVGVQTTGQLRAVQALYVIRIETEELQSDLSEERLGKLREAQQVLHASLVRMEFGDAPEAVRVARLAQPLANQLDPAIERFLNDPLGDIRYRGADGGDDAAEDAMEEIVEELEALLNDSESDPAELLGGKLDTVHDAVQAVRSTAVVLIPLGLLSVLACGWVLRDYRRRTAAILRVAMENSAREARTDQLTSLPNRRALMEELDRRVAAGVPFTLALADLNGFKHYNDTFGHPAGDALLRRLGSKLAVAWEGHGFAARLGGDEFCVVTGNLSTETLQSVLHNALSEEGEGFSISAVSGLATVPAEATDGSAALGLADIRLYAAKAEFHGGRRAQAVGAAPVGVAPARTGTADGGPFTLARMVEERYPALGRHLDRVAALAVTCAELLGLPGDEIVIVERAAQLHDIGKVALPAAILAKRGELTEEEEHFMRRHSAIGERLLSGMDDLEPVAAVIRATHERWDGGGYPDQLAGDAIPVAARIIAVADALTAMTSERPHAPARSVEEALAELHRCSGTQFDPAVVTAVTEAVASGGLAARAAAGGRGLPES